MPVIDAALVERWTQEPPATARGEAFLTINADDLPLDVVVSGDVELLLEMLFPVAVPLSGDAVVAADTVIGLIAVLEGDAEVDITAPFGSADVNITAGIALAEIVATGTFVPALDGEATFGVLDSSAFQPVVSGSATVAFADFGQGSPPLFPFTFPTNFTSNPLNIQTAEAVITITASSENVAAGGFGDAVIGFVDYGTVFPHTFPILFEGLQGSTPIFPFVFPAVFTTQANGRLAAAVLAFDMDSEAVPVLIGDAEAAITSTAVRVDPMRFPFTLPGQFLADIVISTDAYATVAMTAAANFVAVLVGDASVPITSTAIRVDPTRFPFVLPAQFVS
jgi:hypothetical protein